MFSICDNYTPAKELFTHAELEPVIISLTEQRLASVITWRVGHHPTHLDCLSI